MKYIVENELHYDGILKTWHSSYIIISEIKFLPTDQLEIKLCHLAHASIVPWIAFNQLNTADRNRLKSEKVYMTEIWESIYHWNLRKYISLKCIYINWHYLQKPFKVIISITTKAKTEYNDGLIFCIKMIL
jgi:hypothetical protein